MDDPLKVRGPLSDTDYWQSLVEQSRQDLQRGESACVGNEALVAEETRASVCVSDARLARAPAGAGKEPRSVVNGLEGSHCRKV